jgi:hypothetical protein
MKQSMTFITSCTNNYRIHMMYISVAIELLEHLCVMKKILRQNIFQCFVLNYFISISLYNRSLYYLKYH